MSARSEDRPYFLYRRLITHLRTPLYRNGYFLTFSSLATSAIGLVYWILAAHQYPTYVVGINTAVIASMTFLAGIAEVNLMSALVRFVPVTGRSTRRFVIYAYLISLAFAAVISVIFIKFIQYWSPALNFLGQSPILGVWFTISTMLWCIFVLQDSVLTGLRRASLVPLENTVFSLTKIVLMLVFAVSIPSLGIFASWSFALIVAIIPTSYFIFKKLIPLHVQQDNHDASQVDPRQVVRYVAPDYLGSIFWLITTTLMPLIVTTIAGATANAYYYLAWTIANTLYLIGPSMGSSLIVEASTDPQRLAVYSYRVFKNSVKLVFPAALIIAIGAPLILMVFGKDYSSEGALLLRFLALSAIPSLINAIFVSVSRVQRRMTAVLATSAAIYSMILGFSFIFLKTIGIAGVGLAWLLSQLIVAVVVFVTQLRDFWRRSGDISGESEDALLKAARPVFWIHWMYQFAYATKLLPVLTLIKRQWHLRKRQVKINEALPEIIQELPIDIYNPIKDQWHIQSVENNETNTTVAFFGPLNQTCSLVLKLPGNLKEEESLTRQNQNLQNLYLDERLGEWRKLMPVVLYQGRVDGQAFFAEKALSGMTVLKMIRSQGADQCVINLAAAEIGVLHQKTAELSSVSTSLLHSWVDQPLDRLSGYLSGSLTEITHHPIIERIRNELKASLEGRLMGMSWIHGDYSTANILISPDGSRVTGIVDWDLARPNALPLLDLMHLLLSIRMETEQRELGHIVSELLLKQNWKPGEIEIIQSAQADLPGDSVDLRILLILAWLHHIEANLNKTSRYDRNSLWASENLLVVLKAV